MAVNLDQQVQSYLSVQAQTVPLEGPRAIPLRLDFSVAAEFSLNMQNIQSRGFMSMVQAMWVDNSQGVTVLEINFPNTGQTIQIPIGGQGYVNVLCPNPATMSFSSTGTQVCVVHLLNYPVTNAIWFFENGGGGLAYTGAAPIVVTGTVISVETATTGNLGVVEPDGVSIDVAAGVISVPKATAILFGIVEPDAITIDVAAGVISVAPRLAVISYTSTGSTVAALPAVPAPGERATVTDATAPALGVAVVGGGGAFANVHWSPTSAAWIVDGI